MSKVLIAGLIAAKQVANVMLALLMVPQPIAVIIIYRLINLVKMEIVQRMFFPRWQAKMAFSARITLAFEKLFLVRI